jgi:hypothetical protein
MSWPPFEDTPLKEADAIGKVVRTVLKLKTISARRRVLAYAVDKFFGSDKFLVGRLYAGARDAEDGRCAEHNLVHCRECFPEASSE